MSDAPDQVAELPGDPPPDAAPRPTPTHRSPRPPSFAVLVGFWAFAVTQPLLGALGDEPAFFLVRSADPAAIVLFALTLALAAPLVLWLLDVALARLDPVIGRWYRRVVLGTLTAATLVPVLASWGPQALAVVGALLAAVGLVVAYERVDAVALWARFTAILPVLSVALFLFASPTAPLVRPPSQESVVARPDGAPSVLLLVLDELPTASLLDDDRGIDPVRFPNLARFSEDATWFRNHTGAATTTQLAIPAMLTGNPPADGAPLAAVYPNNLFTMLAPTHDLVVSESVTGLCPIRICERTDRSPELSAQLADIADGSKDLWINRLQHRSGAPPGLDDFVETLDTMSQEDIFGQLVAAPTRFNEFVEDVRAADGPTLSYLHLLMPHSPWRLYPDGTAYATTSYPVGDYDTKDSEPWIRALYQQRHLLQAQYADRLVGEVLRALQETGEYDDTLVIVMADHGVAFTYDRDARLYSEETVSDVAYSPLLIKEPGQREGRVDDANVSSLDLLPTVADVLDVPVPWSTVGASAYSQEVHERGPDKAIADRVDWDVDGLRTTITFSLDDTTPTADMRRIGTVGAGSRLLDGLLGPLEVDSWLDRTLDDIAEPDLGGTATLRTPGEASEPEGLVRGVVAEPPDEDAVVLVAVGGRVVSAAPLIVIDDEPGAFLTLLPPDALEEAIDRAAVEVALVVRSEDGVEAVRRLETVR